MKPRNKYEKRVAELNATLSEDIAVKDMEWYKKASRTWDFGRGNYCYFTIYTNIAEFEVKRLYRGYKYTDKSTDHFFFVEIMREFNDGDRKTYFSKSRYGLGGAYFDCFSFGTDITMKKIYRNWGGYQISDIMFLSCASHHQSNGERVACESMNPNELARVIKNNPVAETMYKNNDRLFGYLLWQSYAKELCRAVTIAKRHGFEFTKDNTAIWFDMVRAIIYCKKDWHNPVYVAPSDLFTTHNKFVDMRYRKEQRDREQRERRREELRLQREYAAIRKQLEDDKTINERYIKRRKRFYDMVLTDGLIECRVLRDVYAFEEEGTAMHHCVFKCRYYTKPYSLILSARINDQRIETVEVDLTNYTIKQCYGKHDQFTMYHQRIKDLVTSQMDTIKAYNRRRTKKQIKIAV